LVTGLSPDPLGSSQRSPRPLADLGEEKGEIEGTGGIQEGEEGREGGDAGRDRGKESREERRGWEGKGRKGRGREEVRGGKERKGREREGGEEALRLLTCPRPRATLAPPLLIGLLSRRVLRSGTGIVVVCYTEPRKNPYPNKQ
jgi:hypothetical protein